MEHWCGKTPVAQHYKNEMNNALARNACELIEMDFTTKKLQGKKSSNQ